MITNTTNQPNRSNKRFSAPLKGLFSREKKQPTDIFAIGVYCHCMDGKIREVNMNVALAKKIIGLIKHIHGGEIQLNDGIFNIQMMRPISKRKGGIRFYTPLKFQLCDKQ